MQPQIAIVNKSRSIPDDVLAYAAKACDQQVIECAAAWGVSPTPVAWYRSEANLPARDVRIMAIVDDIDAPGALGYHDFDLGVVYGRVLAQGIAGTSVTLSHECLEELLDPTCDRWMPMPDGRSVALEVCDPVEADTYDVDVEILDSNPQKVTLSNYILPKWFEPAERGAFDRLGLLARPFAMTEGGYMIVRDRAGNESNVFARPAPRLRMHSLGSRIHVAEKLANSETRLARRLRAA